MPNQTTPDPGNSVNLALTLAGLLRPEWDERLARIPAWHPRNEVDPAAAAAAAAQQQTDWESDENPYRKRFTDTQASFTQNQQRLKDLERYEQDPNAYLELGKKQGWIEVDDPNAGQQQAAGEQDPYADRWQRLEAAEARLAEHDARIAAENSAAGQEMFHQDLDTWAGTDGIELTKADHNAIFGLLMQAPDPTQEATAKQIYEAHVADKKAEREQWQAEYEEARKRPRVPHVPTSGQSGTEAPDWSQMTPGDINRYMVERVRGHESQT